MRRLFVNALELHNVTKRFGEKVIANDHVSLTVRRGEILAVLGENGSGKTTLMNMIAGIYHPDEGEIYVNGQPVTISSPRDAFRCGIGMVHQHFKLVDVFTATENIVLGVEDGKPYRLKEATRRVEEISARYGFEIDAKKKIYAMSVSEKQTVEIVKVLYRGAEILILDEPTAVLTPQETEKLFAVLRRMREDGKSIVIITHKLNEVLSLSDRVTVLHKGKNAGTVNTAETNEAQLTEMMVGQKVVLNIERKMPENPEDRLVVKDVSCLSRDGVQLLGSPLPPAQARSWVSRALPAPASGSCWKLLRACSPSPAAKFSTKTPRAVRPKTCGIRLPCKFASWASAFPSCRRIGWAWVWLAPWI